VRKPDAGKVLVCPHCLSRDLHFTGDLLGARYECRECGYAGALVLEVEEGFDAEAEKAE